MFASLLYFARRLSLGSAILVMVLSVVFEAKAQNGSFLRTDGQVRADAEAFAEALGSVMPVFRTDGDSVEDESMAFAEGTATAHIPDAMAFAHAEASALNVVPIGATTFTPQVTVTTFNQGSTSASGPYSANSASPFQFNRAFSNGNFQLDLDNSAPQGQFHGFLYVVGFGEPVITNSDLADAIIVNETFVQSSITIGGTTYTAAATYRAASDDWQLTANLPGGILINQIVGSVNHHFDFVVPIADSANIALGSSTQVGTFTGAAGTSEGESSSATIQLTTSGLAWGVATEPNTPPAPGDFNGDGVVDGADFNIFQANFGIEIGAAGPQGDANLDGAVDAADYVLWRPLAKIRRVVRDWHKCQSLVCPRTQFGQFAVGFCCVAGELAIGF